MILTGYASEKERKPKPSVESTAYQWQLCLSLILHTFTKPVQPETTTLINLCRKVDLMLTTSHLDLIYQWIFLLKIR